MINPEAESSESAALPYREALRSIGAFLDSARARDVVLAEVAGGYLWSYRVVDDERLPRNATISYVDLPRLREQVRAAKRGLLGGPAHPVSNGVAGAGVLPMYPNGYEENLRSLGAKLDSQYARQIQISEHGENLLVRFVVPPPAYVLRSQPTVPDVLHFREDSYSPVDLAELVTRSRNRRGSRFYS
ncbi:MAG TPA: hypothetical protein VNL35_03145 [Chloroflexota bacterium]|nr:hypothetical protein [Chloroflexota bacterium]